MPPHKPFLTALLRSAPVPRDAEIQRLTPRHDVAQRHRRRRQRKKKKRKLSIPAPLVFYLTSGLSVLSTGLVYLRGTTYLAFSIAASVLILAALLINESYGFSQSKQIRRSYEARTNFTKMEVFLLFGLLMAAIYVSVSAWIV